MHPISLYIHWPFCKSKCPYCDFNSHVREGVDAKQWQRAYLKELDHFAGYLQGKTIASVFFGGGTPSLMPPAIVEAILARLGIGSEVEVTLEANPTSVEAKKFKAFRAAGVNRASLGIQSLNDVDLKFLGREHNATEAIGAIALARETFPRYSFDLIYARPGQSLMAWEDELQRALTLAGKHVSLYQLTIEKGTKFYSEYRKAQFTMPEEGHAADLYHLTESIMNAKGMPAYEVSNYAAPGEECRHNLTYWNYGEYLGIGPGAHSRVVMGGKRHALMMTHHPENWLAQVECRGQGVQSDEVLHEKEIIEEALLMGLRLTGGIDTAQFQQATGKTPLDALDAGVVRGLTEEGLLVKGERLAASYQGRMVLNALVGRLVH